MEWADVKKRRGREGGGDRGGRGEEGRVRGRDIQRGNEDSERRTSLRCMSLFI